MFFFMGDKREEVIVDGKQSEVGCFLKIRVLPLFKYTEGRYGINFLRRQDVMESRAQVGLRREPNFHPTRVEGGTVHADSDLPEGWQALVSLLEIQSKNGLEQ
jgi:hypothetical protein